MSEDNFELKDLTTEELQFISQDPKEIDENVQCPDISELHKYKNIIDTSPSEMMAKTVEDIFSPYIELLNPSGYHFSSSSKKEMYRYRLNLILEKRKELINNVNQNVNLTTE